jgi:transcription factor IIIB subunit 2
MVGQFVSATSSKAYTGSGGGRGGRYGFSRASRETTLANGRRRIQDVASRLRLGSHYVDSAHRLFTIAVEKNFVQGRRTTHVVAACLYIACRQEKSQHMLIDFSDALQVNVYVLGTCFLKFRRLLGLKLEIIDPALFVYRFAAHLDLDDKANAVALTALRLVGRMKRDWIVAGRRPAGICAAALLIAARAHGFSRHHQDVTKILRVCGMTVTTRVKEFEHTQSAMLTLEQFNTMELENEADPPVFTRNRIREVRVLRVLITSEPSPNDLCRFFLHHVRLVPRPSKRTMLNCSRADFWMIHVKANVRPSGDDRRKIRKRLNSNNSISL